MLAGARPMKRDPVDPHVPALLAGFLRWRGASLPGVRLKTRTVDDARDVALGARGPGGYCPGEDGADHARTVSPHGGALLASLTARPWNS